MTDGTLIEAERPVSLKAFKAWRASAGRTEWPWPVGSAKAVEFLTSSGASFHAPTGQVQLIQLQLRA